MFAMSRLLRRWLPRPAAAGLRAWRGAPAFGVLAVVLAAAPHRAQRPMAAGGGFQRRNGRPIVHNPNWSASTTKEGRGQTGRKQIAPRKRLGRRRIGRKRIRQRGSGDERGQDAPARAGR